MGAPNSDHLSPVQSHGHRVPSRRPPQSSHIQTFRPTKSHKKKAPAKLKGDMTSSASQSSAKNVPGTSSAERIDESSSGRRWSGPNRFDNLFVRMSEVGAFFCPSCFPFHLLTFGRNVIRFKRTWRSPFTTVSKVTTSFLSLVHHKMKVLRLFSQLGTDVKFYTRVNTLLTRQLEHWLLGDLMSVYVSKHGCTCSHFLFLVTGVRCGSALNHGPQTWHTSCPTESTM